MTGSGLTVPRCGWLRNFTDSAALAAWLGATRGVAGWQWEALGRRDLREYQAHQLAAGAARRTLARRLSAIRAFYKWLHQE
ncbi:MAG: site-specific integrase, partial [Fimbriimonadaceae bacterium]